MHEFSEVQALVRQACAQVSGGARIRRLKIVVGEASGHNPHHIEAHFAEASRGTRAEGAALEFIHEKACRQVRRLRQRIPDRYPGAVL